MDTGFRRSLTFLVALEIIKVETFPFWGKWRFSFSSEVSRRIYGKELMDFQL